MTGKGIKVKVMEDVPALIDTGASVTSIDADILRQLGYPPIGITKLSTPSDSVETAVYMVRLIIPSRIAPGFPPAMPRIVIDNIRAVAVQLGNQPYKELLGRDVLSKMVLIYNGPQALITLGY